ncbi:MULTISPECIES: DUF6326 family protein [Pseudoalteromonas]|uniref:DUF6326 family protein n=1 Tax=Pseudoalteromonas TaxID=53246 RepID=UPI0007DAF392|nr:MULTISPECIES: DUF6326 family protein [Pseudoalteromonas]NMR25809.1 hypothetical protein [Pseudoalteromonas sp. NEC-BIFX-2020_015]
MLKLSEYEVNIKIKLSAIWASAMSLYIYCDYFELYTPEKLESMINGTTLFGSGDQGVLLGLSSIMLVTSLMICLSILLPATINRVLNILVGLIMTLMLGYLTYVAGWYFYKMYAAVEAILTLLIVWFAWTWPKESNA